MAERPRPWARLRFGSVASLDRVRLSSPVLSRPGRFEELVGHHSELVRRWMIATRLGISQQRPVDLLVVPLASQVARVILDEAVDGQLPYSQATGAALLGSPPSLNKVISGRQCRRLIDVGYRSTTSLDARALWAQAQRSTEQSG
jgi:hypothetical protein